MKIFRFVKKVLFLGLAILSNFTNALYCISMKNQECKVRPEIIDINSNNPIFYPFSFKINKYSGDCNNISDPYARICISDTVKNLNVKVFNLMSLTNETRHIKWHEKCKCICKLDKIICNSKQRWNENKSKCECKELIDKRVCDKGFIWNPNNCECECDKNCNIGEYLDCKNCKCRKKLADKLIDECTETIEKVKLAKITPFENKNNYKYNSCKFYIELMIVVFTIFIGITVYYNWSLINNNIYCIKFNNRKKKIDEYNYIKWVQKNK